MHGIYSTLLLLGFLGLNYPSVYGQNYGLGFYGSDTVKDKRTWLDLNPENYFSFHDEVEISFSMRLGSSYLMHFGYIARIVDKNGNNIDIMYNGPKQQSFQIIYKEEMTNIRVSDNFPALAESSNEIRLKLDLREKSIRFSTPDTTMVADSIEFKGKIKILFGANDFAPFKTSDVPAMTLKDIRIFEKGKLRHHFPLDESYGEIVNDKITDLKARVAYPDWIRSPFHDWNMAYKTRLNGFAAICYNPDQDVVYLAGRDSMRIFRVSDPTAERIDYSRRYNGLQPGSQVFYDTTSQRLFSYNLRRRSVHYFHFQRQRWERISLGPLPPPPPTPIWFHNKYYSAEDSTLYIFGGYGQHKYYKIVQRYRMENNLWDTVSTTGDVFHPRYHAALGLWNDTLFILGGFGSTAGDQTLNPRHYSDLMAYSPEQQTFKKLNNYSSELQDIDFAHSMVFTGRDRTFYVLASTLFDYESYLQLLKGNLSNPELTAYGNKIPYLYHNENAYSDLFYSEKNKKLIAVTFLANQGRDETEINVYTLSFPPHLSVTTEEPAETSTEKTYWPILISLAIAGLIFLVFWIIRSGKKTEVPEIEESIPVSVPVSIPEHNGKTSINSVLFFGGFQITNKDGEDITSKFTPLLKELFLLIFLSSIKDKGISIQKLTEIFWFSMDVKSAKNNRAVNIAKLKNLLAEIEGIQLSRKTGYWQIVFNDSVVYNDYWTCLKLIGEEKLLSKEQIERVISITVKGPLLGNADYEWLDEFKSECSNLIIDTLMSYTNECELESDCELAIRLADTILVFDILHEEAIAMKCKALTSLGKHNLAINAFTKFEKDYQKLYGEPFDKTFNDLVKS